MGPIFISYRREDAAAYAGRLYDRLSAEFGADQVFIDIDKLEPGQNFAEVIREQVGRCETLIALIGPRWLSSVNSAGEPRLQDPQDFVRLEIAAALARDVRVVPVLVGDATMPSAGELPPDLADLPLRHAHEIRHSHFHNDTSDLIEALQVSRPGRNRSGSAGKPLWRRRGFTWLALVSVFLLALLALVWAGNPFGKTENPPEISGRWSVAATTSNGQTFKMAFNFRQTGDKVFGKVVFPVATAGVLDGTITGSRLSFHTWHQLDEQKHRTEFVGEIKDQVIEMDMQTEQDFYKLVARREQE